MKRTQGIFERGQDFPTFAKEYFRYLGELLAGLDLEQLQRFMDELLEARQAGNTVFIIGNGGSASTASHMANDLTSNALRPNGGGRPLRALALTESVSCMTAVANDERYENIFINQLKVHYRPGDKLIVISASGNSPNVVAAAQWVKEADGKVLGLLGFDGGRLLELCDVAVFAQTPPGNYGPVEDVHMIIDHLIYTWLALTKEP
ncbi:MAG: SIS domain-containing protein [Desulfarculaceae bacterium]|nr:SIS domain-containing protein [Desulfarculaceae bacterium]MCF8072098.1 SIS domain-containing protein [Desulfarculaceae bacterium]